MAIDQILTQDRLYAELDRYAKDGRHRAALRISATPPLRPGDSVRIHIREWVHTTADPVNLIPGRGIPLIPEELDAVIYALALARKDAENGVFRTQD